MEKLLLLTSVKLLSKLVYFQNSTDTKVLIIDDTVEIKRGKYIEGSCKIFGAIKKKELLRVEYCVNQLQWFIYWFNARFFTKL